MSSECRAGYFRPRYLEDRRRNPAQVKQQCFFQIKNIKWQSTSWNATVPGTGMLDILPKHSWCACPGTSLMPQRIILENFMMPSGNMASLLLIVLAGSVLGRNRRSKVALRGLESALIKRLKPELNEGYFGEQPEGRTIWEPRPISRQQGDSERGLQAVLSDFGPAIIPR